jgi:hypothetical protein
MSEETRKVFTYDEAAAMLPEVRRLTEEAFQKVESLSGFVAGGRPALEGQVEEVVGAWARELLSRGLEVKGLWLVDFDNGSGYYCWQYPEEGLQFYHSYEDGFRGRIRIH